MRLGSRWVLRLSKYILLFLVVATTGPALAALRVGQTAPDFTAAATLGGKPFTFSLSQALKQGPVVVYFYPAAFTKGCTVEAHEFATAMPQFAAMGASVIGVSADDIETLNRFSVSECQSKFPVASDANRKIMTQYDAKVPLLGFAKRSSYVIAQDGTVRFSHTDMDPDGHVAGTLSAVRALKK